MEKILRGVMLLLLLAFLSISESYVQTVRAQEYVVYIHSDGSVDPPTAPILRNGDVYTLTGNINTNGGGVEVERDNIVVDGVGYTVQGAGGGWGIHLRIVSNVTIKNVKVEAFEAGIRLDQSSGSFVSGNNISSNKYGISCAFSLNNHISGNNITASGEFGIELMFCSNNVFRNNALIENAYGLWMTGESLSDFVNDVDVSNTVDGKPIYYWIDETDRIVPSDAGQVVLVNCTRITVKNLELTRNGQGVYLAFTTDSNVTHNNVTDSWTGIAIRCSSNNSISENEITNSRCGIFIPFSSNNSIIGNRIVGSSSSGIWLLDSSTNNNIFGNRVVTNEIGIWLWDSSGNSIWHNDFVNNARQVEDASRDYPEIPCSLNIWNDSYPSGGNYWSDYTGTDLFRGIYQNETGSDGIGDVSCVVCENNTDHYPLIKPFVEGFLDTDLNRDGKVNIRDITIVAVAYKTKPGDPRWNVVADLDKNGEINIIDIAMVARDYGKTT